MHLGTFHIDKNEFHVADEDGIQGDIINVSNMMDEPVVLKGVWKITRDDFETFRISWLNAKYPSIDWYGGRREVPGVPQWHPLGTD
jgi:hypothetical protein